VCDYIEAMTLFQYGRTLESLLGCSVLQAETEKKGQGEFCVIVWRSWSRRQTEVGGIMSSLCVLIER